MNVILTGPGLAPLVEESAHALGTTVGVALGLVIATGGY